MHIMKTLGHQLKELSYSPEKMRASKRARVCDLEGSLSWNVRNGLRETSQKFIAASEEEYSASRDI